MKTPGQVVEMAIQKGTYKFPLERVEHIFEQSKFMCFAVGHLFDASLISFEENERTVKVINNVVKDGNMKTLTAFILSNNQHLNFATTEECTKFLDEKKREFWKEFIEEYS